MLVLQRRVGESVIVGDNAAKVVVLEVRGGKVRLGFDFPPNVEVHRQEVWEQIHGNPPQCAPV